jgi:glutathione synthase/RimK-type ligase-like ATP-grasp enzyme
MIKVERKQIEGEAQHFLIVDEAEARGAVATDVSDTYGKRATRLTLGQHSETIVQGIPEAWINERALEICDQKQLTKKFFSDLDIPSLKSITYTHPSELKDQNPFDGKARFVSKPSVGGNGLGVVLNIKSYSDLCDYFESNKQHGPLFLLEEMYVGYDLRIQVINGQIIAACRRLPAFVEGDGELTLNALIEARQCVMKTQNPSNHIIIDQQSLDLINAQGYSLESIIPQRLRVKLKEISNMSAGGHAIDVTDEMSSEFAPWVVKMANELQTGYFALDLIGSAVALEINAKAEWMHHTFSEVKSHDLAKVVVDVLFGE